ncbi:gamma carbonic anhydrase family protein [Elongatibacter sediminis]|uniref:Gamma carbonic anhydrase family protein n=1 Tax=Elongatibacter sediminis TaxID=3119006 RepID=A0AAW9RFW9_9GAMM
MPIAAVLWYHRSDVSAPDPQNPYRFQRERPRLGRGVYLSPQAFVAGDVVLGDDVSVWPMAVIRGDVNRIVVGARCNIQDGAVLHVTHEGPATPEGGPLVMGEDITVGHRAILHACTVGARCLIGMGAIVMDRVVVGDDVMIGAGAVVTPGTVLEPRTLWKGSPARLARPLSDAEVDMLRYSAGHYVRLKDRYLEDLALAASPGPDPEE